MPWPCSGEAADSPPSGPCARCICRAGTPTPPSFALFAIFRVGVLRHWRPRKAKRVRSRRRAPSADLDPIDPLESPRLQLESSRSAAEWFPEFKRCSSVRELSGRLAGQKGRRFCNANDALPSLCLSRSLSLSLPMPLPNEHLRRDVGIQALQHNLPKLGLKGLPQGTGCPSLLGQFQGSRPVLPKTQVKCKTLQKLQRDPPPPGCCTGTRVSLTLMSFHFYRYGF